MQSNFLSTTLLPIALGIIMLGLGLALSIDDFKRVIKYPKAVAIALICQMVLLPAICFFVAKIFGLEPALAVGLMLLAASPGGATANLYSHLSDGDVALNITLTAVNSVLTLFTLPLVVNFSLDYFMTTDQYVPMQFSKVAEVFAIVLVPVMLGMLIKSRLPAFATKMDKPVKILSAVFLILIIIAAVYRERVILTAQQAVAIGMEIGIHNGTLAIFIALSVLNNSIMSVPAALYSLLMFFTAALFGYLVKKNKV